MPPGSTGTASGDEALTDLIAFLARSLVDKPDDVEVVSVPGEHQGSSVIELRVAREDLGKVIGRQGRTARALRTILSAACMKARKRALLEILE